MLIHLASWANGAQMINAWARGAHATVPWGPWGPWDPEGPWDPSAWVAAGGRRADGDRRAGGETTGIGIGITWVKVIVNFMIELRGLVRDSGKTFLLPICWGLLQGTPKWSATKKHSQAEAQAIARAQLWPQLGPYQGLDRTFTHPVCQASISPSTQNTDFPKWPRKAMLTQPSEGQTNTNLKYRSYNILQIFGLPIS